MEVHAISKYIRVSPRKMQLLVKSINMMHPENAINHLGFIKKSGSEELKKLLLSAIANAKGSNLDLNKAVIKEIQILPGGHLKRFRAVSRGMAHTYKKRMSHVKVILTDELKISVTKNIKVDTKKQKPTIKPESKT